MKKVIFSLALCMGLSAFCVQSNSVFAENTITPFVLERQVQRIGIEVRYNGGGLYFTENMENALPHNVTYFTTVNDKGHIINLFYVSYSDNEELNSTLFEMENKLEAYLKSVGIWEDGVIVAYSRY